MVEKNKKAAQPKEQQKRELAVLGEPQCAPTRHVLGVKLTAPAPNPDNEAWTFGDALRDVPKSVQYVRSSDFDIEIDGQLARITSRKTGSCQRQECPNFGHPCHEPGHGPRLSIVAPFEFVMEKSE